MNYSPVRALSRKWLAPIAAGLLALASAQPSLAADEPDAPKGAAVTVLKAAKSCFASIVEATGIIIPRQETAVRPERPGLKVAEIPADAGDTVTSGGVGDRARLQANAGLRPQHANDGEQIFRGRISRRPKHPHQALWRSAERGAEFFEADRGVDARAQSRAPLLQIAVEQRLHRLAEQGLPEFSVAARPRLHCLSKTSCQGHDHSLPIRMPVFPIDSMAGVGPA